ncbi:MAG: hypothetical protein KC978_23885, partial [Candidatus Omnitrophica bacterium]|nr:hypothetical protein [Candidatus Omnitrophota bacterium]
SNPEALQPYIQKVSEETGWDPTNPPEWEILEEKNAVYIHTRGSGGSANPTLPKDQPWFLTLYGMEEIQPRMGVKTDQKKSVLDPAIEDQLEKILSAYAQQRSLFTNLRFKARWVAPLQLNFPGHYTPFAEPRTILGNLMESMNTQGIFEQEFWIGTQGRYLLKSANTFRPLVNTQPPESFPTSWSFDRETYRRSDGLLYSTENPPAFAEPRTVPTFFMDHLFNEDWLSTLKDASVKIQKEENGNLRVETTSETTGKRYVAWLDPDRFAVSRMEVTDPEGITLTKEIEFEETGEGFWQPSNATVHLDPNYIVEMEVDEFELNGSEPDLEIDLDEGRNVINYRESSEITDVYMNGAIRKTYEEIISDPTLSISGIVKDRNGTPLSGVRVQGLSQRLEKDFNGRVVQAHQVGDYLDARVAW